MSRGRLLALAAAVALVLLLPARAAAHAELLETTPADGETVAGTPEELSASFNEPLETEGSTFSIRNAAGERLAVGRIDPADRTRLVIDPVPELAPGTYEMRWQAATADGHIENDTWSFTVTAANPTPAPSASTPAAASASASTSPGPEPTPAVTVTPSGPITPPEDPVGTTADIFLPIIAGLAIVIIGAAVLLSRRGRPSDRE
jgi:methionine-rich copper-binding protein CopC